MSMTQTHVAVECRCPSAEADALAAWLPKLATMVERGVLCVPADEREPLACALRRIAERVAEKAEPFE